LLRRLGLLLAGESEREWKRRAQRASSRGRFAKTNKHKTRQAAAACAPATPLLF